MIGTIRRHQKWLFIVIMSLTIVSFLWYFNPANRNSGGGGGDRPVTGNFGSVFGEAITPDQLRAAEQEGRIFFRLNSGEWPDSEDKKKDLLRFAQQRILINAELEQYHITVTAAAAARYTKMFLGIKPDDNVPAEKILDALGKLAHDGNIGLDDIDRFARHQAGQEYLVALVGMSGKLITPQEAEVFFRRENEPMQTELVYFPATNYYAQTKPTEADIEDFYAKRQADYRLPDRIQVNYVAFNISNYLAQVEKELGTNLNDHVDQEYLQENPAAFKDASSTQLSPEAAKAKIKKQILQYTALTDATKEANAFLNDLTQGHDDDHPYTTGDMMALAKAKNLTVQTTEPFDMKNGPEDLALFPKNLHVLFSLRNDDPDDKERSMIYAPSPVMGEHGVYVMGLAKRIPSEIQPLSAVHDQVARDYRQDKAIEMAKAAGGRFESALNAGLQQGKTFDTMCAAQFIRPQKLSPFSLASTSIPEVTDKAEFEQLQDVAGKMHAGQCSPFIPSADGGFILCVKAELPVDPAVEQSEMPEFLARMRERLQVAAFNAWFGRQYQLHFVPPPGDTSAQGG
jgi:hypothetical protein